MVLRYIFIGINILFACDTKSANLDNLLTDMENAKQGIVQPQTATPPEGAIVEPQLPPAPIIEHPSLPIVAVPKPIPPVESNIVQQPSTTLPEPVISAEPKLPGAPVVGLPKPIVPLEPKLPMPPVVQAKPIQVPAVSMTPKLPTVIPESQPLAKPMINAAGPVIEQPTIQATAEVTSEGLDTLNIDSGGNWLEKRVWYKKAEQEYEAIHKLIQKASGIRMKFVSAVSIIGKHIDDFYEKVSFEKGQIDELLQAVLGSLTTEQKVRGGDLSSDERDIKVKIHAEQAALQSIEATMKSITDLDEQIVKTMNKALQEIDACTALETKAWDNFKEIGIILDDKKARVLYFEIENFYKNIEKKIEYLESNLLTYLQSQLSAKLMQQTAQIETTVNSLKAKGLNLETLLAKDSNGDFIIFKEREEQLAKEAEAKLYEAKAKEAKQVVKTVKKEATWYENLWCIIMQYLCPIIAKLSEWIAIVWCCIQTLLCKIQEMICKLFGQ